MFTARPDVPLNRSFIPSLVFGILILLVAGSGQAAIPASERNALLALYNATNGANWANNTGWTGAAGTECRWAGVTCNSVGNTVEGLRLVKNRLSGSIPAELGNLTNLQFLYLHQNQLTGSIPPQLGNLKKLTELLLLSNQLSGSVPAQLGGLSSLQILYLSDNQFTGSIPPELGNLTNLIELTLRDNQLSGSIPRELGNLSKLGQLWLFNNQLSGSIPRELGNLSKLVQLWLFNNQLSGSIPPELANLQGFLILFGNQLSGSIPPEFGNGARHFNGLNFSSNRLSGPIPPELGNGSIESLSLSSNQLSGQIPPELANIRGLRDLSLSGNQLTGPIPPQLGSVDFRFLGLANNNLTGSIPPELGSFRPADLETAWILDLSNNNLTGSIPPELGNTNLFQLRLSENRLSGPIPAELGNSSELRSLILSNNELSGSIPQQIGNLTKLTEISFWNNRLSGTIPAQLGNLSSLRKLSVRGNQLSGPLPSQLSSLNVGGTGGLLDLYYNALSASGSALSWADSRNPGWSQTQTVAPANLNATASGTSITLTWSPIAYMVDGGRYEIYTSIGTGPFVLGGTTSNKSASSMTLTGLPAGNTVRLYIQTVTDPHGSNQNQVRSEASETVSASTVGSSCSVPPGQFLGIEYSGSVSGCNPNRGGCMSGESLSFAPAFFSYNVQACDTFSWNFGDGTSSTSRNAVKAYSANGSYTVTLRVSNVNGQTTAMRQLAVGTLCTQPIITSQPQDTMSGGGVTTLTVAASGTAPLQYQWYRGSQGDTTNPIGGAVSASVITPPFASGETTARYWVRVSNACGQDDSRTAIVGLEDPCASVGLEAVAFEYRGAISGCAPGAVSCVPGEQVRFTPELFVNGPASCLDRIVESSTFDWNFGDGRSSSERSPSHTFSGNGPYTVTLTVTHASGQRQATQQFAFAPQVVITGFPEAIVGSTGGGDTTSYTLRNVGGTSTTVNLSRQGTTFSQSPESFTLAPGSSQQITITSLPVPQGRSEGRSIISGQGVPAGTSVPIIILAVAPPIGDVIGFTVTSRVDVSSPVGVPSVNGSATFKNIGTAALTGVLASDVPWLIPSSETVSIAPGEVADVSFTIDPSLRPDGGGIGTYVAKLSLVYRLGTGQINKQSEAGSSPRPNAGTGSDSTNATVSHTAAAASPAGVAPPLREGEVAIFLPGIAHVPGSVGVFKSDLTLTNLTPRLLSRLQMYFKPAGITSPRGTGPFDIGSGDQVNFADVAQSSFQNTSEVGSLQVRGAPVGSISASATVFNSSNPAGSYGTTIPAFRSDRSAGPGERIYLSGITSSADTHTNVYLQEASGFPASATIEFFSAQGVSLGKRMEGVEAFALRQLNSSAPMGAVSAVVTTTSESAGRLLAYATPVDRTSGDTWAVADWAKHYGYDPTRPVLIPVATAQEGANGTYFRTDVSIMNSSMTVGSGTMRFFSRSGATTDRYIALPPGQSMVIADVLVNLFGIAGADGGYIVFITDSGAFAITSRTYATVAGRPGTFGSGVPTLALGSGISGKGRIRFGGLSDASGDSVQDRRPQTFRTNVILVETAGQPVTVTATLRYASGGVSTAAQPIKSVDYSLGPRQFIQINQISHALLGAETRRPLGDLSNMQLEFTVKEGNGAVVALTSTVDNGTGDSSLRVD